MPAEYTVYTAEQAIAAGEVEDEAKIQEIIRYKWEHDVMMPGYETWVMLGGNNLEPAIGFPDGRPTLYFPTIDDLVLWATANKEWLEANAG